MWGILVSNEPTTWQRMRAHNTAFSYRLESHNLLYLHFVQLIVQIVRSSSQKRPGYAAHSGGRLDPHFPDWHVDTYLQELK